MPDTHIPYTRWLHRHDEKIRNEFPERRTADISDDVQLNYYTVSRKATRMGVQKTEAFMHSSWKKGAKPWAVKGEARRQFKANADEYMRAHFHDTSNAELARLLGVDEKTIRRWARRLGLQKSEAFMQAARARGHAKIRQGYYTTEHLAWRRQRIADVYPNGSEDELLALCKELGVSRRTVCLLAMSYGIHRSEEHTHEARKAGMVRCGRTKYDAAFIARLREYYPDHTNRECEQHFGIGGKVLAAIAHSHGIRKSREHLQQFKTWATRE